MTRPARAPSHFDEYASDYDRALAQGLSVSGESSDYFARGRVERVAKWLDDQRRVVRTVLDFGCGTGSAVPLLLNELGVSRVIGIDTSSRSLDVARNKHQDSRCQFSTPAEYVPAGEVDMAFCNGVFHHIEPADRGGALDYIRVTLAPKGLFAFWENNPLNPGTRYVMRRIPFDRDANTLTPWEARRLLTSAGFRVLRTDYAFFFPRFLKALRGIEPHAAWLPLGAQYGILCERR